MYARRSYTQYQNRRPRFPSFRKWTKPQRTFANCRRQGFSWATCRSRGWNAKFKNYFWQVYTGPDGSELLKKWPKMGFIKVKRIGEHQEWVVKDTDATRAMYAARDVFVITPFDAAAFAQYSANKRS